MNDIIMKQELLKHIATEINGEHTDLTTTESPKLVKIDFDVPCPSNSVYVPPDCIVLGSDNSLKEPDGNTILSDLIAPYPDLGQTCNDIRKFNTFSLNASGRRTIENLCLRDGFSWPNHNCQDKAKAPLVCDIQKLLQSQQWRSYTSHFDVVGKMLKGDLVDISELERVIKLSVLP